MGVWDSPPTDEERASVWDTPPTELEMRGAQPRPSPSAMKALGRGLLHGASFGGSDEGAGWVQGALQTAANALPRGEFFGIDTRYSQDPRDVYRAARGGERLENQRAQEAHPGWYGAGDVAGDATMNALLAAGTGGATLTPAGQGAIGLVRGFNSSDADLTMKDQPLSEILKNYAQTGGEMALQGGLSWLVGKGGEKFAKALSNSGASKWMQGKIRKAIADEGEAQSMKALKGVRSATAELGGRTSTANRTLTVLQEILEDPMASAADKAAAKKILESEVGNSMKQGVYKHTIERAPGELGRLQTAQELLETAQSAAAPEAIEKATEHALANPFDTQVKRRAIKYGSRFLPTVVAPVVGTAVGNYFDAPWIGAGAGMAVGSGMAAGMGAPGTALANMLKSPSFRKMAFEALESALVSAPGKTAKMTPAAARAAADRFIRQLAGDETEE